MTKLLGALALLMLVLTASVMAQHVPAAPRNLIASTAPINRVPASRLKVLHWNTHYGGIGSDGVYDPQRVLDWIYRINPDVMSLNEIEKFVPGHGNEDQPALYQTQLTQRTNHTWYAVFAQRSGNWSSNSGSGNLILSRFPIVSTARLHMTCSNRSAALAIFSVNNRNISFVSTHIDSGSATCRTAEVQQLVPWVNSFPEQRILAGDWNQSTDIPLISSTYYDGWLVASTLGTAIDFVGNPRPGGTYTYRIDKVFSSKSATALTIYSAQVFDTRDANGVTPSDHKPLLVTYEVR